MTPLNQALRGALKPPPPLLPRQRNLLLLGGGGTLGAAVLAEALVVGRFARVQALVQGPLESTLRGLEALAQADLQKSGVVLPDCSAVIVFERQRHSNGRDAAFVRPEVGDLLHWARSLRQQGVQRLIVVVPHAPALLPHALRHGLATLDEAAVQALDFEHLLLLRAAQHADRSRAPSAVQRLADWWLSQLRWMVPQQEQPLRAARLAACVVALARGLPEAAPGTRVLTPDALQLGAGGDISAAVAAWLQAPGGGLPGAADPAAAAIIARHG